VACAGFCAFLGLYLTQPMLPTLEHLFHAGKTAVSMTVTAATIGVALAAPLMGSVADRFGRKRVIVFSASLMAVATLAAVTATGLATLVFWRFVQGLLTPGIFATTVAYVQEEWVEGGVGRAMAIYVTGTVIGGFTGRMTAGLIVSHWDWRWSFVAAAAMIAAMAAALQAWLPKERRFVAKSSGESLFAGICSHLHNRRLLATYAMGFGMLFTLVGTFTYVTFHLAGPPFRLGPLALGYLFCTYLVGAVVTPRCGRLVDRYGQRTAVAFAIGAGVAGILLTLIPNLWMVVAGLCICCSGVFVTQAAASSYIGLAANGGKALAVGLYVTCYYLGGSVGAELPGFLWRFGGWTACVAMIACVQLLVIAIALVWWPTGPSQAARRDNVLVGFD
jgi:MFS family permease